MLNRIKLQLMMYEQPARYTDPHFLAILTTTRPRHLLTNSTDQKGKGKLDPDLESQAEFVRLSSRRTRSNDEPLSTYRSIHTSKDRDANSDSDAYSSATGDDAASSSESDADSSVPRTAHQHSLAALEAALQRDPTSLSLWNALLDRTLSTAPPSAKSSLAKARAEIKLSVLDRAIRTHRQNAVSIDLRVKWLNAGAEVWDGEKLEKEWEQAVTELGGRTSGDEDRKGLRNRMWEEWLRWRIASAGRATRKSAGVDGIISDARRAMDNLEGEKAKVKLLWRIAVTLRDAGEFKTLEYTSHTESTIIQGSQNVQWRYFKLKLNCKCITRLVYLGWSFISIGHSIVFRHSCWNLSLHA